MAFRLDGRVVCATLVDELPELGVGIETTPDYETMTITLFLDYMGQPEEDIYHDIYKVTYHTIVVDTASSEVIDDYYEDEYIALELLNEEVEERYDE